MFLIYLIAIYMCYALFDVKEKINYIIDLSKKKIFLHFWIEFFIIPNGIPIKEFQKGQAIPFRKDGRSIREIAKLLNVSKTEISNCLRNSEHHETKKKTGRSKTLTPRDERNVIRELKKKYSTISNVRIRAGLTRMLRQTVYNYIKKVRSFSFSINSPSKVDKNPCS